MRMIFIRHGDPDYEHDDLTEKGKREAEALSQRVKGWQVKDFYCSPMGRAKATAKPTMEKTGRNYTVLDWAQEFFHLVDDGRGGKRIPWDFYPHEWAEEENNFVKNEWVNTPRMRSGDISRYYRQVCDGLDELTKRYGLERNGNYYRVVYHSDDTIVIFCHYGFTMIALSHLLNIPAQTLLHGMFTAPTSVTVLNSEERFEKEATFRCQTVGDVSHLRFAKEPISSSGYFAEIFQE